jgi:hypothetical protein
VQDWVRKDFTKTAADLRDRSISRFNRKEARRLEFWTGDKMGAAVDRGDADAQWINSGSKKVAEQGLPNRALLAVSPLKADKVEKEDPTVEELAKWQLDPAPRKRIVVRGEGGALIADLRIGQKVADNDIIVMEMKRRLVGHYGTRLEDVFPGRDEL